MALSEFAAMETAYRALVELDAPARTRALAWLSDALVTPGVLPQDRAAVSTPTATSALDEPEPGPVLARAVKRTRGAARPSTPPAATDKAKPREAATKSTRGSTPRARKAASPTGHAAAKGERVYRRMPPADEVMGAYRQVGTISGLAEHYQVPLHTIQGWARRLRKEGHPIGRTI